MNLHDYAMDQMTGHMLTHSDVDNARAVLAIRAGYLDMVLRKRKLWVEWLTVTQRQWQRKTRRPQRARHHDSVAIREKHVRCG